MTLPVRAAHHDLPEIFMTFHLVGWASPAAVHDK